MNTLDARVDRLQSEVGELRVEVRQLRTEVGELRAEVGELRTEVGELRTEVGELRTEVRALSARVDALGEDVSRLRILYEDHTDQIRKIAEVQASHGEMLMELRVAILPLRELHELVPLLAKDHERRIPRLDTHTGLH